MRSSYRGRIRSGILLLAVCAGAGGFADPETELTGFITDTECGANHAPMIAKGAMGKDDRECTIQCVRKGATYGFVDAERKRFYQLDDQDAPAPYAGLRVRIRGRVQGDTLYVQSVAPATD